MSIYSSKFNISRILNIGNNQSDMRLISALDGCQTNVMLADNDLNIIYMNKTMQEMMRRNESEIRKTLPNFNASSLIGTNIDVFHKNPSHQRALLRDLSHTYTASINVGSLIFNLIANPIISEGGKRTGISVEWEDVTEQKRHEVELARIADENSRIKMALDGAMTNVMLADENYDIIYMNRTMVSMMKDAEADIKEDLPNFDANRLLGSNIDIFHKNPAHQRGMLDKLASNYKASIKVGCRTFTLSANPITNGDGSRLGTSVEWEDITKQLEEEEKLKNIAAANARIKVGLDKCSTNVMLADNDRVIIYANESVMSMLRVAERDLQKSLPNFSVDKVLGSNIDIFHKNPAHQKGLLESLASTYTAEIAVGVRKFSLIANPVRDDDGNRLGTVVEWNDITLERQAESEIASVVNAISVGDFSTRIDVSSKDGFMLSIAEGINAIAATCETGLTEIAHMLRSLSSGDLTQRITNDYEGTFDDLKQDSNTTAERLSKIVYTIADGADEVAGASSEIADGSVDLSERTETQASSLEETAAAMEEMSATVKTNSENSQEANQLSKEARQVAIKGGEVVDDAVVAMAEIEKSSQNISDIIGVIDEIAFQTNLLALNAAVEAARAGDAGKGFAVVASEVRTLAQRSSEAAKDIKTLIVESGNQVKNGVRLVGETGQTLSDILKSIKSVTDIVAEIAAASEEQASGIDEINKSVAEMDDMTQQNSALVEENAAAAKSMEEQALYMKEAMTFFSNDENSQRKRPQKPQSTAGQFAQISKPVKRVTTKQTAVEDDDWSEF